MKAAVGTARDRVDGPAKVTGAARYTGDFHPAGMAHGVIVPSAIARGSVDSIGAEAARALPGVALILTRENMPALHLPRSGEERPYAEMLTALFDSKIHYAGQAVAVVVADSLEIAQHAAALLEVRYREEAPVLGMNEGRSRGNFSEGEPGREGAVFAGEGGPGVA